ncbi:hypothetical protein [Mesorhizobium sp.]|uniref:hypothetical protein n=1 Tax=Mesorhizobium sp. TaxID=1871066 RepID=UPI000FE2B8C8|nr:hypothetical protein [Mesorhizobium sp.]RWA74885.1 MAG: hypothetical protein EOQ28_12165 [Mesorhizobium sp.]RWC02839.1 MAG: hypothetical protein EOQ57_09705 [Mesorhizobium sp.]RWG81001.1 MAG: hypothetical protein EOQ69_19680 [Mesorhizobium sp.]RWG89739.1 MAG: hypothetical protein EOQ70_06710 [Mesorhizobium sp.]RWK08629.1 MAG: hypothetical protein EOR42_05095 [Mesorhizobium sp.]
MASRVCLAALFVAAPLSAHADGERWSMIPAWEWAVRVVSMPYGYERLKAVEDFEAMRAAIEYSSRDDHGARLHHSAQCRFWHRRLSGMSIDNDVQGQIIVD